MSVALCAKTPIGFYIVKATSTNVLGEDLRIVELEEVGERKIGE